MHVWHMYVAMCVCVIVKSVCICLYVSGVYVGYVCVCDMRVSGMCVGYGVWYVCAKCVCM